MIVFFTDSSCRTGIRRCPRRGLVEAGYAVDTEATVARADQALAVN